MKYSTKTLDELCDVKIGKTPPRRQHEWFNSGSRSDWKWVSIKDMGQCGKYITKTSETITDDAKKNFNYPVAASGTILLSFKLTLGRVAICDGDFVTNEAIAQLPIKDTSVIDRDYLYYYLKNYTWSNIGSTSSIATAVNSKIIKNLKITFPDLQTQKKIVRILSAFDNKIELNNRQNQTIEHIASELIKDYQKHQKQEIKLSDIMTFDNGFAFKSKDYVSEGRYKVITIKNVQDGNVDSAEAQCLGLLPKDIKRHHRLETGDILLSLTGNVGRVGIVFENNLLLNQRVAKIHAKNEELRPFLYFVFRQESFKARLENLAKGTAQLNLSPVETLMQSINYEEKTALLFSEKIRALFEKIIENKIQNKELTNIRDILLSKLMNNEINLAGVKI